MLTIQHKNITWIDIEKPRASDILFLKEKFDFHPLLLEEFMQPSQRPRAEEFDNCLYVVIHIPLFDPKKRQSFPGELDIVITKNHLITVHAGDNVPLKSLIKEMREDIELKDKAMGRDTGFLLYFLLENLLSSCFPKIDHINEYIAKIEEGIFEEREKEMVKEISAIKRDIIGFRRTLKPQRSILESLLQKNYCLIGKELNDYFQDLIGTNIRVWNALENTKEVVEALEETNNSLLSYKINEAMRFLSAVSLITFTLSVTTGIFSMAPFQSFSSAKEPATFWTIVMVMAAIALTIFYYLRKKKWL